MQINKPRNLRIINSKIIGWIVIAIYTFILPDAILVYQKIVSLFGQKAAGKVPLIASSVLGVLYILILLIQKRDWENMLFLIPCGLIAFAIFILQSNPNKHIHIPEYVLMVWLLHWVLSKDIQGKEIIILIFIYAALLGVTDELEQGIHPARFYGASDMLVNASSALIGVFTILGLTNLGKSNWKWVKEMKKMNGLPWLAATGIVLVLLMCIFLFQVQAVNKFWGVYPTWLWIGNVLFLVLTAAGLIRFFCGRRAGSLGIQKKQARLWVVPLLVILFYMQTLVMYVSVIGVEFQ